MRQRRGAAWIIYGSLTSLPSTTHALCMRPFSSAPIEVERKYACEGADVLQARVLGLGGRLISEKSFTDTYYDTEHCALTRRDTWLRQRDKEWELKLPGASCMQPAPNYSMRRKLHTLHIRT